MLQELFNTRIRVAIDKFEMITLSDPKEGEDISITSSDSISWEAYPTHLRVKFLREISFVPECCFQIKASYVVDHFLTSENSLSALSPEDIAEEINSNPRFFIQESQGFIGRIVLLIAQATSAFGGPPLILPTSLQQN